MIMRWALVLLLALAGCTDGVAKVGSHTVSRAEFDAYLRAKGLDKADDQRKDALLQQYLEREALAQGAQKSDRLDQSLLQAELDEQRREVLISRYFEKFLRDTVTDEAVRN